MYYEKLNRGVPETQKGVIRLADVRAVEVKGHSFTLVCIYVYMLVCVLLTHIYIYIYIYSSVEPCIYHVCVYIQLIDIGMYVCAFVYFRYIFAACSFRVIDRVV